MRYKIGDKVRIKEGLSGLCDNKSMLKWQGKTMTIRGIEGGCYKMREDVGDSSMYAACPGWDWHEDMIESLVEPGLTQTEILKLAIETYGTDEQSRMCQEEMSELSVALNKHHREHSEKTLRGVREEIADVCVMMQQAKMMFGEKEVDKIIMQKVQRLKGRLEEEREVQVVEGRYSVDGETYTWINPDGVNVKIGHFAIADTKKGHAPIIVTHVRRDKLKNVEHHKKIVTGGEVWE